MRHLLIFFILGIGSAVLSLGLESFFIKPSFWEHFPILLAASAFIEEFVRFSILILAEKKNVVRRRSLFYPIFFGIGFAGVEILLMDQNLATARAELPWVFSLILTHILLTIGVYTLIRLKYRTWILIGFFSLTALHWGYNLLILLVAESGIV